MSKGILSDIGDMIALLAGIAAMIILVVIITVITLIVTYWYISAPIIAYTAYRYITREIPPVEPIPSKKVIRTNEISKTPTGKIRTSTVTTFRDTPKQHSLIHAVITRK